jgi:hypothetical protein
VIRGVWGSEGVALSHTQFMAARVHGDRYWLYVVEFADDTGRAVVHPIHDPFSKIGEFRFDRGWRQLADPAEAPSAACTLTAGQRVSAGERGAGRVERVVSRGSLRVIRIRLEAEGSLVKMAFDPAAIHPLPEAT